MNLIDVMGLEYGRSKRRLNGEVVVGFLVYVMTIASIFWELPFAARILAGLALIAQVSSFFLRQSCIRHFALAEQIRRMAMMEDGLGIVPSDDEIAVIWERIGDPEAAKPSYERPYYESSSVKGPIRLLEITRESVFFTKSLARSAARTLWTAVFFGLGIVIFSFVMIVQFYSSTSFVVNGAKLVLTSMSFWAVGDLASMAVQFGDLDRCGELILSKCTGLLSRRDNSRDAAIALAGEYNCAVIQAPPIPEWLYNWRVKLLNKAWRNRKKRKTS